MPTLRLGHTDRNAVPNDKAGWLAPYHRWMAANLKRKLSFRDEPNDVWRPFQSIPGSTVKALQIFLKDTGFFPNADLSGIFGYGTQSAVRLFQEYVRNYEGDQSIGTPDGIAGPKTMEHIERWKQDGIANRWNHHSPTQPSQEYIKWLSILHKAKETYIQTQEFMLEQLRNFPAPSDSFPPEQWAFRPEDTHLIGIRRFAEMPFNNRKNEDLFILLTKGMVFKFWGSTQPNPQMNPDREAYLVEGQHKYRFSWHKISSEQKIYKALRPYSKGVLVFRDMEDINALNLANIEAGIQGPPNMTINIHWSGDGDLNFSAGCQVIAGRSYIDDRDQVVDCRDYAAGSYNELGPKTRGAYNVLTDLIICYSPKNVETVWYTMGRESNLEKIVPSMGVRFVEETVDRMKGL